MKIGTWNSCGPIGPDRARFLASMNYDIWAFQECESNPPLGGIPTQSLYIKSLKATNDNRKNLAIVARWPLSEIMVAPDGNAFACIVDAPAPFVFGNLWSFNNKKHCDARSCPYFNWYSCSSRMIDFFISVAEDLKLPLIAAGDLNSSLGHPRATAYARKFLSDALDRWESRGLKSAYHTYMRRQQLGNWIASESGRERFGEESQPTVFGKRNGRKWQYLVDYIFADAAFFRPNLVRTWDTMKSDHAPVLAEFDDIRLCSVTRCHL